jgi:hypothetical protein
MEPYAGDDYNLTLCPVSTSESTPTHGQPYARVDLNPMPESIVSASQGLWIWPRLLGAAERWGGGGGSLPNNNTCFLLRSDSNDVCQKFSLKFFIFLAHRLLRSSPLLLTRFKTDLARRLRKQLPMLQLSATSQLMWQLQAPVQLLLAFLQQKPLLLLAPLQHSLQLEQ